jgi:TatD DNase family protein
MFKGLQTESNLFYDVFSDIGANLTDPMYQGIYNGLQKHQPDLDKVLERSWNNNLSKIIITAGNLEDSKKALEIAKTDGIH